MVRLYNQSLQTKKKDLLVTKPYLEYILAVYKTKPIESGLKIVDGLQNETERVRDDPELVSFPGKEELF